MNKIDPNGTFGIVKNGASYVLPTFKVEKGKGLVLVDKEGLAINFVKGTKTDYPIAILELEYDKEGTPKQWNYKNADREVIESFELESEKIQKVHATLVKGTEYYQLSIMDEGIKAIRATYKQVLGANATKLIKDNLPENAYIASIDVEQVRPAQDGITTECLLNMLIHNMKQLQMEVPCRETSIVVTKLEEAQMWIMKRRFDRKDREVENTYIK